MDLLHLTLSEDKDKGGVVWVSLSTQGRWEDMADEKQKGLELDRGTPGYTEERLRETSLGIIPRGGRPSGGMTYKPDADSCRRRYSPLHLPWKYL